MPATVSPVIDGADDASPQPTRPSSVSILTNTFSTAASGELARLSGRVSGNDTAIGVILAIRIGGAPLASLCGCRFAQTGTRGNPSVQAARAGASDSVWRK